MAWSLSWPLSIWLALVRVLQLLAAVVCAALNGYLLVYIYLHRLGLGSPMTTLEIMICVVVLYTSGILLASRIFRRFGIHTAGLIAFVIGDVIFTGVMLAIMSVLARTGVPANCVGLTRTDFSGDDAPNNPPPGYTTIRFSDEEGSQNGVLDRNCDLERGFYFLTIILIFSYMVSVTLTILHILESSYTRIPSSGRLAVKTESSFQLELKMVPSHQPSPVDEEATIGMSSEGITSSSPTEIAAGVHRSHSPLHISPVTPVTPTMPVLPVIPPAPFEPPEAIPTIIQPQEIDAAEAAMVTDGYRQPSQPGMHQLPPYTPGQASGPMAGHADESNEMRLSEYVKGQTRAQDMKDAGGM